MPRALLYGVVLHSDSLPAWDLSDWVRGCKQHRSMNLGVRFPVPRAYGVFDTLHLLLLQWFEKENVSVHADYAFMMDLWLGLGNARNGYFGGRFTALSF